MNKFIKNNYAIMLAFILPIALIVVVALSIYIPSLLLSTNYNFIYSSCTDNTGYYSSRCNSYFQKHYSIVNNRLIVNDLDPNTKDYTSRIFLHDTKKNESREITLKEAKTLTLNQLLTSSDGVTISSGYNKSGNYFFIFGSSRSSYGHFLTKGKSKSKLNLINQNNQSYNQKNFQFIGWILPERN